MKELGYAKEIINGQGTSTRKVTAISKALIAVTAQLEEITKQLFETGANFDELAKTYSLAEKETNMNYLLPDENIDLHIKMATIALDKPGNFIVSPQNILAAFAEIKQSRARERELERARSKNSISIGTHPSLKESVTVPHNVIGTYEDASGGRSDIVTLSDKREMNIVTQAEFLAWAYAFVDESKALVAAATKDGGTVKDGD